MTNFKMDIFKIFVKDVSEKHGVKKIGDLMLEKTFVSKIENKNTSIERLNQELFSFRITNPSQNWIFRAISQGCGKSVSV